MRQTKLGPHTICFHNQQEYHSLKREIFTFDTYYFEANHARPVIIDAGAHIGLTTLYFKRLYPQARITAIEPHPQNFECLEQMVYLNDLSDVELQQAALWSQSGQLQLHADTTNTWLSSTSIIPGTWEKSQPTEPLAVTTITLDQLLAQMQPVDLLKIDIEGSEATILPQIPQYADQIQQLLIEYHPNKAVSLDHLVSLLSPEYQVTLTKRGQEVTAKAGGLVLVHAQRATS